MATKLAQLKEDGKVYLDTKDFPKFEKQLKKAKIKFFAFDVSKTKTMVELEISE